MAYLMPDEKQQNVYYNSLFFKKGYEDRAKKFIAENYYPPKWQRMVLEHNEIIIQNRSIPAVVI
jgi:hypothetical protein